MRYLLALALAVVALTANAQQSTLGQSGFLYFTNECYTVNFIGTNVLAVAGAGTATANGAYSFKSSSGTITVWTNANGQAGVTWSASGDGIITNGAGTTLYNNLGNLTAIDDQSTGWSVSSGAGPAPTVKDGTNVITTCYTVTYPVASQLQPGVVLSTNLYFVNPVNGNDSNAIPGRIDRPWKNFTNALFFATHTNDTIELLPGTNYFGFQNIQLSNGVSIVGQPNRDACWILKDASLVDASDISLKPGIGTTLYGLSGNISVSCSKANVYVNNLYTVGFADNLLLAGTTNFLAENCTFEVNGPDSLNGALVDASVISSGYNTIKNCIFISKRRGNSAVSTPTTRRGLCIKGGTNFITGCTAIVTDSTNQCYAFYTEAGYASFSGCNGIAYTTNGFACVATNANDSDVAYTFPSWMIFSNTVAWWPGHVVRTNFIGGQLYTNIYSSPIYVSATISNVVANSAGATRHALWVYPQAGSAGIAGVTNFAGDYHQAMGAAVAFTNLAYLGAQVMPGQVYGFTNQSSGAGNDSKVMMGQIRW